MKRNYYLVANCEVDGFDELIVLIGDRNKTFMTTDKEATQEKLKAFRTSYPYVGEMHELTIEVR